jgi:Fe(II)/alpha-ketoglutarate-dependent arginine beta-hydroxylase
MDQNRYHLSTSDVEHIRSLVDDLARRYDSSDDPEFLCETSLLAHELPLGLRRSLNSFRLRESSSYFEVSGYPIDQERIGPTPQHWRRNGNRGSRALVEEIYLVLVGSLLGEPIAWATQQDGRIVHDIAPIAGHESEQLGSGSEQPLWWHTEDAFHPYRGDYLGMLCLRNPDRVATTVAEIPLRELHPRHLDLLFEPHYVIRPDNSHKKKNSGDLQRAAGDLKAAYLRIEHMDDRPEKIAILYGSRDQPYIRIDPFFMDPVDGEAEAQRALDALIELIDGRLEESVLAAGDICILDNLRMVHGRRPFKARYDGNDRWLMRINVTRDLRKSRDSRPSATSRIIG